MTFFACFLIYVCFRNNWEASFSNLCKGINKLNVTLLVHWNVGKYSDHIVADKAGAVTLFLVAS